MHAQQADYKKGFASEFRSVVSHYFAFKQSKLHVTFRQRNVTLRPLIMLRFDKGMFGPLDLESCFLYRLIVMMP
jgi:hypothetical protein